MPSNPRGARPQAAADYIHKAHKRTQGPPRTRPAGLYILKARPATDAHKPTSAGRIDYIHKGKPRTLHKLRTPCGTGIYPQGKAHKPPTSRGRGPDILLYWYLITSRRKAAKKPPGRVHKPPPIIRLFDHKPRKAAYNPPQAVQIPAQAADAWTPCGRAYIKRIQSAVIDPTSRHKIYYEKSRFSFQRLLTFPFNRFIMFT